jgi:hypothetical protein
MARGSAVFGFVLGAAVIGLGVAVAVQHHEIKEQRRSIDRLSNDVRQLQARKTVVAPPPKKTRTFLDRLVEIPSTESAAKFLGDSTDSITRLLDAMKLSGPAADTVREKLSTETTEWSKWIDQARAAGTIDELSYLGYIQALTGRTDGAVEDLLDEAQRTLYERWRDDFVLEQFLGGE